MSCKNVQERISLLIDGKLPANEREDVLMHSGECRRCATHLESLEEQRALLRNMAPTPVPAAVVTRLSVLASHERERQLARVSPRERFRRIASNVSLAFDNIMRPAAVPFAGGILSALVSFGLMVPVLSFTHSAGSYDFTNFNTDPRGSIVATPWQTAAADEMRDFPMLASPDQPNGDYVNVVNLTIDENGKVVDWDVVRGQLTDEMKSIIMMSTFKPATSMGINTSGTIQVRQSLTPCKYARCSVTVRG